MDNFYPAVTFRIVQITIDTLNTKTVKYRHEHNVLGSISFMYAIETSSTVLVFKGTVIR